VLWKMCLVIFLELDVRAFARAWITSDGLVRMFPVMGGWSWALDGGF